MDKMQEGGNQTQETKQQNMHCFAYQIRYYEKIDGKKTRGMIGELDGVFGSSVNVNCHHRGGNQKFDKS